jgi:hypothetical protein
MTDGCRLQFAVQGDKLTKKNSLSGNRLRAHSVTGRQIK